MKRLFALILSITLLFSGCGVFKGPQMDKATVPPTQPQGNNDTDVSILPEQMQLSGSELTMLCEQIDFSLLAAAFYEDRLYYEAIGKGSSYPDSFAYVGDSDGAGHMEMIYTGNILTFVNNNGNRHCSYMYSPSGSHGLYLDKDGHLYKTYYGELDIQMHNDHEHWLSNMYYSVWTDAGWDGVFNYSVDDSNCDADLSYGCIDNVQVAYTDFLTFKESLGLRPVETKLHDFLSCTYDATYYNCFVSGLAEYFEDSYVGYQGSFLQDIDSDGHNETVIVLQDFVSPWFPEIDLSDEQNYDAWMDLSFYYLDTNINPEDNRTGFVIVDIENDKMTVDAGCILERIDVTDSAQIIKNGSALLVNGKAVTINGWADNDASVDEPAPLTIEEARQIYNIYSTYCLYKVCDITSDYIEGDLKREIVLAAGFTEADVDFYYVHAVPCCNTEAESYAHVQQYVADSKLSGISYFYSETVEYEGKLYTMIPGMGLDGYLEINTEPVMVDKTHATVVMDNVTIDYTRPEFTGYFAWMDGHWKLTDIKQGVAVMDYSNIFAIIAPQLEIDGYTNIVIKHADLGSGQNDELLCLCQRDGVWYLIIYIIVDGAPVPKHNIPLSDKACYLTEYNGDTYLLTYIQNIVEDGSGTYHSYSYTLSGFDSDGNESIAEQGSTGYYDSTANAQQAAAFFEKLNKYLVKIIVLYDPYKLTGKSFMEQSDASFGQVPPEPEQEQDEKPEEMQMGFVQINDPDSWLNLREGPGLSYECVRLDPNDPGSIVRQALGSPVTVMEEVESADGTWLKVRITYQDRIIEGYSYKAYIRLVNE